MMPEMVTNYEKLWLVALNRLRIGLPRKQAMRLFSRQYCRSDGAGLLSQLQQGLGSARPFVKPFRSETGNTKLSLFRGPLAQPGSDCEQ
jgi:hypothetical protein